MADISQIKIGITTYNIKDSASYKKPSGGIPSSDLALFSNLGNAGTSKYLREDGTWAEPVGGGDITTPTLLTAPTSSTTTYTKDVNTLNFYIGQFCRVADATMDTGYKFYQLADLNNGVATWLELGTPLERTTLGVSSNNPSLLTSLRSSATITVTDEDDNEVFSGTLPQTRTLKLTPGISYTVSAAPVTGYATPQSQTFEAEYEGIRSIDMEYDTTVLTVTLSSDTGEADLSNVTITVTDTTASSTVSPQQDGTYLIPTGHDYSVAVSDDVEGYDAPSVATGTASGTTASVTMTYTEITDYVDLGLPSGMLWATGNITKDASDNYSMATPEVAGAFFSWGNIDGHRVSGQTDSYNFLSDTYSGTAGKGLETDIPVNATYDAARARLGGKWRMPTEAEANELINNCTWTLKTSSTSDYGVAGYEVVGPNGNKIFLIASGFWTQQSNYSTRCYFWTSTMYSTNYSKVVRIQNDATPSTENFNKYYGVLVRAVQLPHQDITITLNPTDGTSASGISVTVTDSEGAIHTGTTDSNGQVALQGVANGSATVSAADYVVYNSDKITVTNSAKSFTIQVAYRSVGVYAYYSDGTLKTEANADTDAIGVAVITSNCSFVIDKTATNSGSGIKFGGYNINLSSTGVLITDNSTTASADFDGEGNTTKIINYLAGKTDGDSQTGAPACEACRGAFSGQGYMGSLGEWYEAFNNKTAVNSMMSKIGGTALGDNYFWTSTLVNNEYRSWLLIWTDGTIGNNARYTALRVRAFRSL